MKRLIALGSAVVLGSSVGSWAAHAEDATATVEGRAYTLGTPAVHANRNTVAWGCAAVVSGAVASTTTVTCALIKGGVVVASQTATAEGSAAAATPIVSDVVFRGGVTYCWTAEARLVDGTRITDDTLPNCI